MPKVKKPSVKPLPPPKKKAVAPKKVKKPFPKEGRELPTLPMGKRG